VTNDSRTEPATPKRKREARRRGTAARSAELPAAASLAVAAVLLPVTVGRLAGVLIAETPVILAGAASATPEGAARLVGTSLGRAMVALVPLVAAVAVVSTGSQLLLAGGRPNLWMLRPRFERVSPRQGIRRLASRQALWELGRNAAKLGLLGVVAFGTWEHGVSRLFAGTMGLGAELAVLGATIADLARKTALLALVIGVVDAVVSRRRVNRSLRMTKQEVRDEHRQTEGNPETKGAIRARQRKLSRSRMIAAVARADVVLTNPTHLAVALTYQRGAPAPVVVAKGAGDIAERIKAEARRHGVPVMENKPLARALFRAVEVGDAVPAALWRAVAEVLAVVYRLRGVA
jgi:flagellar biosynthetic protein FlhB